MQPSIRVEVYTTDLSATYGAKYGPTVHDGRRPAREIRRRLNKLAKCWVGGKLATPFANFSSRIGWTYGGYFVKLDDDMAFDTGEGQSKREWENWQDASLGVRKYLVPILAHGISEGQVQSFWVAQRRCTFLPKCKVERQEQQHAYRVLEPIIDKLYLEDVGSQYGEGWAIEAETRHPLIYDYGM